jgi:hypothetical protein
MSDKNVVPLKSSDELASELDCDSFLHTVAECRECGKLIGVGGEWQDGHFQIMTTGGPIFGKCPSKRAHPRCGDKFAATAFVVESPRDEGDTGYHAPYVLDPFEVR